MRILIVDDLESNRFMLAHLAEREGHVPMTASSAADALKVFEKHGADLVFMDVVMPDVDGYVAAQSINEAAGDTFVPIIFITALQNEDALVRCLEYGDDYLVRPFNDGMFRAKLAAHIRTIKLHHKARQQHEELAYLHQRLIQEQEMAEHVFEHAAQFGNFDCHNIETYISSASQFNGDVFLQARAPDGGVYAMLGDFTGHGLPAALGSLPLAQAFKALTLKHLTVGALAQEMNRVLVDFLPDHMFCAAVIAEIPPEGDRISLWSGGLHETFILDEESNVKQAIESSHMPLGILEDREFNSQTNDIPLAENDKVVLYTDGILEATNDRGEFFGKERLRASLKRNECDIDKVRKGLMRFTDSMAGDTEQDDDISIVAISAGPLDFGEIDDRSSHSDGWTERPELPWSLRLSLGPEELKAGSPISQMVDMIGEATGLYSHKPILTLLFSEIYNNALDHGILKLDSSIKDQESGMPDYYRLRQQRLAECGQGEITIDVSHTSDNKKGELLIKIEDSGDGFDVEKVWAEKGLVNHGRGLSLIRQLCKDVQFDKGGKQIFVRYEHNA